MRRYGFVGSDENGVPAWLAAFLAHDETAWPAYPLGLDEDDRGGGRFDPNDN